MQRWGLPTTQTPGRLNGWKAFPALEPQEAGCERSRCTVHVWLPRGSLFPSSDWLQICSGLRVSGEKPASPGLELGALGAWPRLCMAGAVSDLVRTLGDGAAGAKGMTACHSWGEAVGGPGDPWNQQQLALGSSFKCFQLWEGVRIYCKVAYH